MQMQRACRRIGYGLQVPREAASLLSTPLVLSNLSDGSVWGWRGVAHV